MCDIPRDTARKVGKKIRVFRAEYELTQEKLAKKYGCQQRSLSDWENGVRLVPSSLLFYLSNTYGISLSYFDVYSKKEVLCRN